MKLSLKLIVIISLSFMCAAYAQSVTFSLQPNELKAGDSGVLSATLVIPEDKGQTYDPNDTEYFYLSARHPDFVFGKTEYPQTFKKTSSGELKYYNRVTLSVPFKVKDNARIGKGEINTTFGYNLCYDSGMCDPPEELSKAIKYEIAGKDELSSVSTDDTDSPVLEVQETEPLEEAVADAPGTEESSVPWRQTLKYLLFAFLGGVILNITPCVLPILPIRIMSIINHAQKDRSKVLSHTLVYTLGVMLSFAIMAGFFIGLQAAGQSAGWGTQNQNPYFVITLMAIVFVFALSLLGVFEITAPGMNTASKATAKGGYSGSFFGGIFAFLMAISCTGPFLGAALPFAMKLSPGLILVFFIMIGLGFAFPFILIGLFPKALKIIPKPGDWMVLFKELMGFVLLYLVFTMLRTTLQLTDAQYFLNVIYFMLILGFAIWLYGKFVRMDKSRLTQWVFTILPVLLITVAAISYLPYNEVEIQEISPAASGDFVPDPHAPEGWYVFSPQLLERLLSEGKSIFLDIGAAWCKNCHTNEKTVLFTNDIMADFLARDIVLLRGDFTKKDEVLLQWIKKHDRLGVPFNALYIPGEQPILFPELITKGMIRDAIAKVPSLQEDR